MNIKTVIFYLLFVFFSFNNYFGQNNIDWKTKDGLGMPFSVVDSDLGEFDCDYEGNTIKYCFYGADNTYDCKSTAFVFGFKSSRVSSILLMWQHNSISEAITNFNYEKSRLTALYGRPEMKNGDAHFFTSGALISCGFTNDNLSFISFYAR
ncbi:hypothetical protein OAA49_01320 [Flavobacteriales bacterium]|nr:hypothetical protein [Flavobacteriales bacterium]